jgi:uncharacterized protein
MQRLYGDTVSLSDREVMVVAGTSNLASDGHIIEMSGMDLSVYRRNPIVLWQHDAHTPIGVTTAIGVENGQLIGRVEFAPQGASEAADTACNLVKAGVVRALSIGWDTLESRPLDPTRPYGGQRITASQLLEISFVSVPADSGALVTSRNRSGVGRINLRAAVPVPMAAIERASMQVRQHRSGRNAPLAEVIRSLSPRDQDALRLHWHQRWVQDAAARRALERRDFEHRQTEKALLLGLAL